MPRGAGAPGPVHSKTTGLPLDTTGRTGRALPELESEALTAVRAALVEKSEYFKVLGCY